MSGRVKTRVTANQDPSTFTVNEKILKECHTLYTDPDKGLIRIANGLGLKLLAPRKKITIMMIGNHSAGKSSFINWYIEEHIQRTGVAIETQGFTFVTSGRKRESLTGNATMHLYPHFSPMQKIPGLIDYVTTEISTSKQKKFNLITFIDTPGLVDGDMIYPFDVNKTILWLGSLCDLIFVFFDPMGQALCKRTLYLVEHLNKTQPDRMKFYLSKADEAGHEGDRQRVMMQIVQELCKREGLNRTGFEMPTIYIPNPNKQIRCVNQIDDVCRDIEKTINQTIQSTLNSLEKDCEKIASLVDDAIKQDDDARTYNFKASGKGLMYLMLGIFLPFLLMINFLASATSEDLVISLLGHSGTQTLYFYLSPVRQFWAALNPDYHLMAFGILILFSILLVGFAYWTSRRKTTLSRKQRNVLLDRQEYVRNFVIGKKQSLYQEYLMQSVAEYDL